jgi:hypothetical protein
MLESKIGICMVRVKGFILNIQNFPNLGSMTYILEIYITKTSLTLPNPTQPNLR